MLNFSFAKPCKTFYANNVDAYIPEFWAYESISLLEENMVSGMLVNRSFEPVLARYGDVVNTRQPAKFTAKRKTTTDSVTVQDATATNIPVTLNQMLHVSFMIQDGDDSKAMKDLIAEYLTPAMMAQAKFVDQVVLGQIYRFAANSAGRLGNMTNLTVKGDILAARKVMNDNLVPVGNRNLLWTTNGETIALGTDIFLQANTTGDGGFALREAALGRKLGFNHYMSQNLQTVTATDVVTGAINNASGYSAGATSLTVDGLSAAISNGTMFKVAGDDTLLRVSSTTGGATPTVIVASTGLKRAVVDNAVVTIYDPGKVNNASGYAAGYSKEIEYDNVTLPAVVGQAVSFGTSPTSAIYTIIGTPTSTSVVLDRPLEAALADNDNMNLGPAGDFNFFFDREAIALVVRPLAAPRAGVGALSSVVNHNGFSMRATITYNGSQQGHLVTLDMLFGIAVLDAARGGILYG